MGSRWFAASGHSRGRYHNRARSPHLALGALIALDIWGPAGAASQALIVSLGPFEAAIAPRVLAPLVYLAVANVYLRDGAAATSSLLFSPLITLALVSVGLPLLAWPGRGCVLPSELPGRCCCRSMACASPLAEALGVAIGAYRVVALLQTWRNRLGSGQHSGALVLALLGAGWSQGALTATVSSLGGAAWAAAVRAELLGWAFAVLAL